MTVSASEPYATVVVPTHDRASTLALAIDAIQAQTVPNIEIVISGDGVTEACRAVAQRLAGDDPRLVIPAKDLVINAIDYAVLLGVVLIVAFVFGHLAGRHLWALPVFTIMMMMLAFGSGLIAATLCVLRPDLGHAVPAATRMLFYLSPVVYPLAIVPESIRPWYELNPITTLISGARWSLFGLDQPSALSVLIAVIATVGILLSGLYLFFSVERRLNDIL